MVAGIILEFSSSKVGSMHVHRCSRGKQGSIPELEMTEWNCKFNFSQFCSDFLSLILPMPLPLLAVFCRGLLSFEGGKEERRKERGFLQLTISALNV